MENEYKSIIEYYKDFPEAQVLSETYLKRFWLPKSEILTSWNQIKESIFSSHSKDIPDLMFNEGFELIAQRGGVLFIKEEYYALQSCMKAAGDNCFVLVENKFVRSTENNYSHLQLKFPIDTTWEELNNGDENNPGVSYDVVLGMDRNFFVFGDSGKWGKYAASDYDTPLDIIGFKPELASVFRKNFHQSKEEKEEIINEWLPENYKGIIK